MNLLDLIENWIEEVVEELLEELKQGIIFLVSEILQ